MKTIIPEKNVPEKYIPVDPVFKQVFEDVLGHYNAATQTEVEISRLPRTIDGLAVVDDPDALQRIRTETPFSHFQRYNQVEFKGVADSLTISEYHMIQGRTQLYIGEHNISPPEMSVTILAASKPRNVLSYKYAQARFKRIATGYYRSASHPNVYIVVIRELPLIPKNYPFLLFTSDDAQFRLVLEQMLAEQNYSYIHYAYRVQPRSTQEVLRMAKFNRGGSNSRENLQFIAEDIGAELLEYIPIEKRLAGIAPEQRLAGLAPEQRLAGMNWDELLKVLTPDQRKSLLETLLKMSVISFPDEKVVAHFEEK